MIVGTAEVRLIAKDDFTMPLKKGSEDVGKKIGDETEKAAGRSKVAFKAAFGAFRGAFGQALGPIGEMIDKFESASGAAESMRSKVGKSLVITGAAATTVGSALQIWGDKDRIAQEQLKQAIDQTGGSWDDREKQTEELIKSGEKYGHTAEETQNTLKAITLRTNDSKAAYDNMNLVTNLAAARNISLAQAGDMVAKVYNGNTRVLKLYGITSADLAKATHTHAQTQLETRAALDRTRIAFEQNIIATTKDKDAKAKARQALTGYKDDLKKTNTELKNSVDKHAEAEAALKLLDTRMQGQASIAANTFTGKLKNMRASVEDVVAQVGQKFGPAITVAGPLMMGFGAIMEAGVGEKIKKATEAVKEFNIWGKITQAMTKVWTGIQMAFNLVMDANPIVLIVIAVAALVAAFVLAYMKIKPFHDLINALARDVGSFFVSAWHLAIDAFHWFVSAFETAWNYVAGIVKKYGLIILAFVAPFIGIPILIMKNWGAITGFFKKVWDDITHFFSSAVGSIISWIGRLVTTVWGEFTGMLQKLKILVLNGLADIVNFYIQLPFRIASGLATLGSTIWSTFSKALGTVKTNVVNFFKGAGSWLLDAGKNIITGIIGGITSMGGWFMSQVSKFVSDHLPGFVKKILGIGSPSKVFMEIGKNTMVGLQMGIQSQATSVSSTMNAVMGNVLRSSVMQPTAAAAAGAGVGGGRVVNLFPGATVGMREPADADTIVKRLEALVGGSRL